MRCINTFDVDIDIVMSALFQFSPTRVFFICFSFFFNVTIFVAYHAKFSVVIYLPLWTVFLLSLTLNFATLECILFEVTVLSGCFSHYLQYLKQC